MTNCQRFVEPTPRQPARTGHRGAGRIATVFCFEADTGKILWRHSYFCDPQPLSYEGGPGSTPAVDSQRVYSFSKDGDLFCLEARSDRKDLVVCGKGEILWEGRFPFARRQVFSPWHAHNPVTKWQHRAPRTVKCPVYRASSPREIQNPRKQARIRVLNPAFTGRDGRGKTARAGSSRRHPRITMRRRHRGCWCRGWSKW